MLLYILGASFIIMLASLVGKFTTVRTVGPWIERNLNYLVSFSAGVFTVIATSLALESLELAPSIAISVSAIVGGFILLYLLSMVFPEAHHHHETDDPTDRHPISGRRILISDALHNAGDGFLLAPAFFVSVELGVITSLGILIHELAQEVSEFFVLRQAGYSVRRALTLNFLVSSSILIGAFGGYFLSQSDILMSPLLGLAAGAFLYVISRDLIPHSVEASKRDRKIGPYAIAWLLGVLLFLGISNLLGHAHEHEGEHHDDEHAHGIVEELFNP